MSPRLAKPASILFDLDGTLIDSAPDLAASVNIVLGLHGFAPLDLPSVTGMIGHGIRNLVQRSFIAHDVTLTEAELDAAYAEMMEVYGGHLTRLTVLMPGARETLKAVRALGIATGVVTNKPQGLTETILAHFEVAGLVDTVIGGDQGITRKPAPDMLLAALDRLGNGRTAAIMVGDSAADCESGQAAGLPVVIVRGGYTSVLVDDFGADAVIDSLLDLPNLFG